MSGSHATRPSVRLRVGRSFVAILLSGFIAAVTGLFLALGNAPAGAVGATTTTGSDTQSSSASVSSSSQSSSASESSSAPRTSVSESSSAPHSSSTSQSASCGAAVQITSVHISPTLSDGNVVITIAHTGQGCPNATPATLHVHQDLLASPHAGSNPQHQSNQNFQIGPDFGDTVTVPLLTSVDDLCFVQVDVHAGSIHHGRFFPTTTCGSVSPTESSSAPSSSSAPASSSVAAESSSLASSEVAAVATTAPGPTGPLASTGVLVSVPVLLALALIAAGFLLNRAARQRRH
ncbi:MAG TPA: hypothetical protein VFU36_03265 [Jatrophihabitans sp.]|nr:hypothetical protein [Jatrophihabitans sp.]